MVLVGAENDLSLSSLSQFHFNPSIQLLKPVIFFSVGRQRHRFLLTAKQGKDKEFIPIAAMSQACQPSGFCVLFSVVLLGVE